jgi:hypothetical protein
MWSNAFDAAMIVEAASEERSKYAAERLGSGWKAGTSAFLPDSD